MNRRRFLTHATAVLMAGSACVTARSATSETPKEKSAMEQSFKSPLLEKWTGPYGGVPPFDAVKVEDFKPAFAAAMDEYRRELATLVANPEPATFENTLAAMERAGRTFNNLQTIFGVWSSTMATPEFQSVEREMAPVLAAFSDEITQNEKLFARIEAVYNSPEKSTFTPEQQRLSWLYYTNFVRSGAKLDALKKKRVAELNQKLATLYTQFSQNVLGDEEQYVVELNGDADVAGLPESVKAGAAAEAKARNLSAQYVITNTRSSVEPFLTYSTRRDLREKVWRNFVNRGDNHDAHDNNPIIAQILKLRSERAQLLGYATHAHWRLEDSMAKTPERAMALMEAVWPKAVARVHEEVADMQALARKQNPKLVIEPWDYRFYAEKVRKAKYDLDENELKPYLQLEKLREGMFWVAGQLFGFEFKPITGVAVYQPDVRVWEVVDSSSGKHVGLWYFDPYARKGKRSGAWMNAYRNQERFDADVATIVSNNCNFVRPSDGQPVLVSWEDARTLFHEFGHALHGLASNVNYPSLSGTAVARDYVEFPSQLMESWLSTREVLNRFVVHYKTGNPIPAALVERINKASKFNQGFATVEYLSAALVDMKMHLAGNQDIDPAAFERDTLKALDMPKQIVMRHRTPQFLHVFSGDGYSAGYYSYLWADTLSADAYEAFVEKNGPYDRSVALQLRDHIFAPGNSIDPAESYRAFRGRDPGIDALLRKRGLAGNPLPGRRTASTKQSKSH